MFGLIDGNNFYCSCERAFDPKLRGKPLVVLSNDDVCAIARSQEAKAYGIKMGQPWHLIDPALKKIVDWRSSNYELYGDMSRRASEDAEMAERYRIAFRPIKAGAKRFALREFPISEMGTAEMARNVIMIRSEIAEALITPEAADNSFRGGAGAGMWQQALGDIVAMRDRAIPHLAAIQRIAGEA